MRLPARLALTVWWCISFGAAHGIDIQFDRSLDTNGFFANSTAMAALNAAGTVYEQLLTDDLAAIVPGPTGLGFNNTWEARFLHPSTGSATSVRDRSIPADTIIVYVGTRNLSGLEGTPLGLNSSGFFSSGTPLWNDIVSSRGQGVVVGANPNDYSTWGGSISFNSAVQWHLNPATNPAAGRNDLYSVALHELGHLLGFGRMEILQGLPTRWANLVSGTSFTGVVSTFSYGGPVPLSDDLTDWAPDIPSVVNGTSINQTVVFDERLQIGTRERLTQLDVAALADIGWEITGASPIVLGDYNSDGVVNGADFVLWRNTEGSSNNLAADGSGNGFVGPEDYDIWLTYFGRSTAAASGALAGPLAASIPGLEFVPEPRSLVAIMLAGFPLLFAHIRQRR